MKSSPQHIPTLDGWRAVAALGVVICHGVPKDSPLAFLRVFGVHAVFVFFALSGLLITTRLLEEEQRNGSIDLKAFYLRRVFRILPPAFAFLGVIAFLGTIGVVQFMGLKELLSCMFFLQNYVPPFDARTPYTTHFWSLAVEEHFYLLWPALLVMLGSARARKFVPWIAFAVSAWRIADKSLLILFPAEHPVFNAHRTDHVFDALLWGCYLALALREEKIRALLTRALKLPVFIALCGVFLVNAAKQTLFTESIEVLVIPLMLAATVLRPTELAGALLELRLVKWLGTLSYALYLWQQVLFVAAFREPEMLQRFPINLALLIGLAAATHYLLEEPCIQLGRRTVAWLRSTPPPKPAVAPAKIRS
ncbi:MAG: acyltransferase family protein [Myxococcaceae bacterium]